MNKYRNNLKIPICSNKKKTTKFLWEKLKSKNKMKFKKKMKVRLKKK